MHTTHELSASPNGPASARAVADILGISHSTVVRVWRDTGYVSPYRRSTAGPRKRRTKPRRKRHEQLSRTISSDIADGTIAGGSLLPGYKVLCQRYGACYSTMRQALDHLLDQGWVTPYKKHYRAYQSQPRRSHGRIVLVGRGTPTQTRIHTSLPLGATFGYALERECQRLNVELDIVNIDGFINETRTPARPQRRNRGALLTTLGYIVLEVGLRPSNLLKAIAAIGASGRPGSVLQTTLNVPADIFRRGIEAQNMVQHISLAVSETCGYEVGRYLIGLGHKQVAFFLLSRDDMGLNVRAEGVERAYREAGMPQAVRRYGLAHYRDPAAITQALHTDPAYICMQKELRTYRQHMTGDGSLAPYLGMEGTVAPHLLSMFLLREMVPVFQQALSDSGPTAWVGATDAVALALLAFLRQRNVRVPASVSVMGFDNTPEAFGAGMTSYDFNIPSAVRLMVEHIMRPQALPQHHSGSRSIEVGGTVATRGSSGLAPALE